jgi:1-aminocyclopropane-1-carboxylate deaminase/D-cysteine desulfhydrase-like pyridoxal-dependent ACC family enzyme
MGIVDNPDTLVLIADFFIKMADVTWSVAAGNKREKGLYYIQECRI